MDACSGNPNRTSPLGPAPLAPGGSAPLAPVGCRTNGWSWPPHPFQLLAWLLFVFFAVTGLGVFVPLLPAHWIPAGYICTGVMFTCHLCVHLMAVSVDPADHNVRTKSDKGPAPEFDRSKHAHVIENCHCFLCQVDVGPKSKHCSACNKCVSNFDHHCRWLNNCVGSRNYKLFLHSVVSALVGVSLVLVVASYVFIEFFLDPSKLRSDKHFLVRNETALWFVFLPVSPVPSSAAVIPGLAAVTVALGLLSCVLLCHLLCFHLYLMWNRLSTFEYIVRQRHRQDGRESRTPGPLKQPAAPPAALLLQDRRPLGYTDPLAVEESTTVCVSGGAEFLSVSSPVVEEEAPPTTSTELKAEHTHRRTQKRKKKVRKVPVEVTRGHCPDLAPPPEPGSVSSVSLGQRLSFPACPPRTFLLPLAPPPLAPPPLSPPPGPVQAAAPPAEYHSDSAESLEEIPVALAKLGSSSSHPGTRGGPGVPLPSPQPRAKRKAASSRPNKGAGDLRLEMAAARPPAVFVSRASGQPATPRQEGPGLGRRPAGPGARGSGARGSVATSWVEL
ncbi:palmitoyltransferase ZDHHC1 [Clinocottus analis]|uniref:palmitoyltransferase ZDHHC1 n=1 Tax=Clinocottus analis TaxID=304258 RepID=UPI0035BF5FF6